MGVSLSGLYACAARGTSPADPADAVLRADLHAIHRDSLRTYGRPRLVRGSRNRGHRIGPKRVSRLVGEEGVHGARNGRFTPRTTDSQHAHPVAANVLDRRFAIDAEVEAWVSDITYVPTRDGWLYLAVVIALRTRQVLGYHLARHMCEDLVTQALRNAVAFAPEPDQIVFHSDRGSQYASAAFTDTLQALGFVASMSRKGNCWDNAVAESFFATLKAEEMTRPYEDEAAAHRGIARYILGFYNPHRMHSSLGYLSPDDFAKTLTLRNESIPNTRLLELRNCGETSRVPLSHSLQRALAVRAVVSFVMPWPPNTSAASSVNAPMLGKPTASSLASPSAPLST